MIEIKTRLRADLTQPALRLETSVTDGRHVYTEETLIDARDLNAAKDFVEVVDSHTRQLNSKIIDIVEKLYI